jgi:septum site-determining protein MinC
MAPKPTRNRNAQAACELRSASLTLVTLQLRSIDLAAVAAELGARVPPGLFETEPAVLDLSALELDAVALRAVDAAQLRPLMQAHGLALVAVRGRDAQADWARTAGLPFVSVVVSVGAVSAPVVERDSGSTEPRVSADVAPSAAQPAPSPAAAASAEAAPPRAAMVVDRPLRSGQQVYARGTDLIVMAAVNFGAEVIADGHIHVYAPLRGRAIAGARGDANARIFAAAMEPQLISIAGTYRTLESDLPADVRGKPAQVRLEGDRLLIEPIGH